MGLRPRKSLGKLSSWFNSYVRVEDTKASHLVWILLFPAMSAGPDKSHYRSVVERLIETIRGHDGVQQITLLANTGPASSPHLSLATTARNSHESLFVQTEGSSAATLASLHTSLRSGTSTDSQTGLSVLQWSIKTYQLVQTYQPRASKAITASCKVTVSIEPGLDQESEVDSWYREEQLPLIGATSPELFVRCRRYRLLHDLSTSDQIDDRKTPELLAVHEFVSVKTLFRHSLENGPIVEETAWSKRVFGSARRVERTVWEVK